MHHIAKAEALETGLGLQADSLFDGTLCPDSNSSYVVSSLGSKYSL